MKHNHDTIFNKHISTPCGKTYSGNVRKVKMLFNMHKRICKDCNTITNMVKVNIKTDKALSNQSMIDKIIKEIR